MKPVSIYIPVIYWSDTGLILVGYWSTPAGDGRKEAFGYVNDTREGAFATKKKGAEAPLEY
ncbi:MAG TPA: hypothetical protein VGE66_11340, partial [Chitinophagaceae bacterium]